MNRSIAAALLLVATFTLRAPAQQILTGPEPESQTWEFRQGRWMEAPHPTTEPIVAF